MSWRTPGLIRSIVVGSNAHAIVEQANGVHRGSYVSSYISTDDEFALAGEDAKRPSVLVLSANDAASLRASIKSLGDHLINPRVKINLTDLAYTLSERKTRLWHRAFISTRNTELDEKPDAWVVAKKSSHTPRFGFVFTGQGAQWPQMGKDLLQYFPKSREILDEWVYHFALQIKPTSQDFYVAKANFDTFYIDLTRSYRVFVTHHLGR